MLAVLAALEIILILVRVELACGRLSRKLFLTDGALIDMSRASMPCVRVRNLLTPFPVFAFCPYPALNRAGQHAALVSFYSRDITERSRPRD